MRKTLFLLLILSYGTLQAQYRLSGYLFDDDANPLPYASIVVLQQVDTSIVAFGISNQNGKYTIELKERGVYNIRYSFLGFQTKVIPLISEWKESEIILQNVKLTNSIFELDAVSIVADRIPVRVKGDTIQYDAKAFKVSEGSDVEKLLKKIPGVEIDKDGNVRVHGKIVEKITVDGKEFFGNDPKMATKNLDAEAIEMIEIIDKKSDEAEFTGVDDGIEQKVINLTLKEDFKKGSFGKLLLGVGTHETYKGKVNYNRFSKKTRLSLIGNTNNINEQVFSSRKYTRSFRSNHVNGISGNEGTNKAVSLGFNLNHEFNKKLNLQAFYYYTRNNANLIKSLDSENYLGDSIYFTIEDIVNGELKTNHSFNTKLNWKPNLSTLVIWESNISLSDKMYDGESKTRITPIISSNSFNFTRSLTNSMVSNTHSYNSISVTRKLKKDRRNFKIYGKLYLQNQDDQINIDNKLIGSKISQLQRFNGERSKLEFGSYFTEPLNSFWVAQVSHKYTNETEKQKSDYFDIESSNVVFNEALNRNLTRALTENRMSLVFRRNKNKIRYSIGITAADIKLESIELSKKFQYILPNFSLKYLLTGMQYLKLNYVAINNLPRLDQLSTTLDNRNPQRNYIGNSNLVPEYGHNFNINYVYFNPVNSYNLFIGIQMNKIDQKIVTQTIVNPDYTILMSPKNSGFYQSSSFISGLTAPIKNIKIIYNISPNMRWSRNTVFLNNQESTVLSTVYSTNFSLENLNKDKWDLKIGFNMRYNNSRYETQRNSNQSIKSYSWYANGEYEIRKDFVFKIDYKFRKYESVLNTNEMEFHFVNASLRKSFKNNKWAISLIANDILNQNIGVMRSSSINQLTEIRYNSISQYFMLMIKYDLRDKKTVSKN
jgi:hypothetical protein